MAVNGTRNNLAYGFNNALQVLNPLPIIAGRAPQSTDSAEFGQQWIYSNQIWEYTSAGTWTKLATQSAANTFSSLSVTGATVLSGSGTGNTSIVGNHTTANATFTIANNALVGRAILTGNTIAQSAVQAITFQNSNITASSSVLYNITNTNVSAGAALLTIKGVTQAAGSLVITVTNNGGAGGLGATDSIIISFMILG